MTAHEAGGILTSQRRLDMSQNEDRSASDAAVREPQGRRAQGFAAHPPSLKTSDAEPHVLYDCDAAACENPMCWEHALQYGSDA